MRLDTLSPSEVLEAVARLGEQKGNMRFDKIFLSSVSAGCLLAFACGTALSTNATPWFQENAPGLIRTISALVFPYGLFYYRRRSPAAIDMVEDVGPLVYNVPWELGRVTVYGDNYLRM
ncbi:Formate/nitrite transporter [Penicillium citrinum]|uniref:Formate/nitrite transporter n=1 Tax=Penicillium citrinum TaxID=5077 RepID=A0A9W9PHJ4_PENCI|nr:Formate/nitrite transporter [Penicillium citrinum]KAJ5243524.1 Formate/nitrite transporter [Penicillium citrinum]